MQYKHNPHPKVYNVDFDGVLTMIGGYYGPDPEPNPENIEKVRKIYGDGNIVIIWTARMWEEAPEMVGWLIKNRVPYHGIFMGKGGSDIYVDDKMGTL